MKTTTKSKVRSDIGAIKNAWGKLGRHDRLEIIKSVKLKAAVAEHESKWSGYGKLKKELICKAYGVELNSFAAMVAWKHGKFSLR